MSYRDEIVKIWSRLLGYDRKEPEVAVRELIKKVMPLIGSSSAMWIGSVRNKDYLGCPVAEMLGDWVMIDSEQVILEPKYQTDEEESYRLYMETRAKYGTNADKVTEGALKGAGQSRAHLRSDSLSDDEWRAHWLYKDFNKKLGIGDILHVVVNVDEECESWIVFYKADGEGYFTEEDKAVALTTVMGAAEWLRRMLLLRGAILPCKRFLSPQEQRVLRLLLKGHRDQEIADECGFSQATAKSHTISIYRKFNIGGKVDLMSMFV